MTHREQAHAFVDDLDALITRYVNEMDLEVYEVVGILRMASAELEVAACMDDDEDDTPPSPDDFLDDRKT